MGKKNKKPTKDDTVPAIEVLSEVIEESKYPVESEVSYKQDKELT